VADHAVGRSPPRVLGAVLLRSENVLTHPMTRPATRHARMRLTCSALLAGLAVAPMWAWGAEAQFEGSYRARGRLFDTLTLDRTLGERSEAMSAYLEHRLWLRPRFLVSDDVTLNVDFLGLNNVVWGNQPVTYDEYIDNPPPTFDTDLSAPTSSTDESAPLRDFTLWRAWGDVNTPVGRFKVGRMPLHWGAGMLLNDGIHVNPHYADFGDTADRFQWEILVRDQFIVQAAAELQSEGFVNDPDEKVDDRAAYSFVTAYRSEDVTGGILLRIDRAPTFGFTQFTADGAVDATLGKLHGEVEVAGQFGSGDLINGVNDASIARLGAVLNADLDIDPWILGVQAGLATGDGKEDLGFRTFTFDRDYSIGLMMFEQSMPVLAATAPNDVNKGRSYEAVLTGNAVSNALFLKPRLRRRIIEGLEAEVSWLGARVAKVPERIGDRRSYGMEVGAGLHYLGVEHLDVALQGALFLPGSYYSNYNDGTLSTFDDSAFGAQLSTRLHF